MRFDTVTVTTTTTTTTTRNCEKNRHRLGSARIDNSRKDSAKHGGWEQFHRPPHLSSPPPPTPVLLSVTSQHRIRPLFDTCLSPFDESL